MDKLINLEDAIEEIAKHDTTDGTVKVFSGREVIEMLKDLPYAQPERDKPMKPIKTTDRAWGIPKKQAVCPKCDYYLGHVSFLGDYKGKRITYCETCGQAIDWEGWDSDE